MKELIQEGKILHWGISEVDEEYLKRANAVCPVTAVENNYNIISRVHEDLVPFLEEHHIGGVTYDPMFKGLLSGTFQKSVQFARDDWRGGWSMMKTWTATNPCWFIFLIWARKKGLHRGRLPWRGFC